jgi:hypothetical protein
MERAVPRTGGEEIHLYMRTYYSLLRSSGMFQIETLIESHVAMGSSLHVGAAETTPDISALIYCVLRLPNCMPHVRRILAGQTEKSFVDAGYQDVDAWERVYAPGRRRRQHFDANDTLVVYVVSRSDIDDLVPLLAAYQLEWNKLHYLLQNAVARDFLMAHDDDHLSQDDIVVLADVLRITPEDLKRLHIVWQPDFMNTLRLIAAERKNISLGLTSGSLADYRRATAAWWEELQKTVIAASGIDPEQRPLYFVSSNTHSLVNLLTGFAHRHEQSIVDYIRAHHQDSLLAEYEDIRQTSYKSLENFLYYVLGKYLSQNPDNARQKLSSEEQHIGIYRVPNKHGFEIEAQIIDLSRLRLDWFDARLQHDLDLASLIHSNALILNIDYPLGMAAYEFLSRIVERVSHIAGIYIMGKAATLNARIGDVMLPNVIHDEHSQNTYLFENCFAAADLRPYMTTGNVLDNQKAVTALGTFLQNPVYMSLFYREGYTDIEMEGGPYLSAVYEAFRPRRHPENEIVNLYGVPFDIGFLHYASDTPMKKGQNLGAGSLNFSGVEPTYAAAIAILRRIFHKELVRLKTKNLQPLAQ